MNFLRGLLAARSHLAFLVGLAGAFGVVRLTSHLSAAAPAPLPDALVSLDRAYPARRPAPPSRRDRELARVAWAYLERNTDERTGLTSSVAGYPSTTMWDVGSQLMAILSAEDLGIVPRAQARHRLERALGSLAALPLCERSLPNRAYHTRTLRMVDYANHPAADGNGWSALDVARLLVPLQLVLRREPELGALVERVVERLDLRALTDGGALVGATRLADGRLELRQEGRLGYEQYAASALLPWGVTAPGAADYRAHLALADVGGQLVPYDDRDPARHGGERNPVLSEPWVLGGLERGLDATTGPLARAVLAAQERRFRATGGLNAVSEDHLDRAPWFSYSAVLDGGRAWTAFAPGGAPAPHDLTFSTKAAVGWAALFEGSYPERLLDAAAQLAVPGAGLYAGRYDEDGAVNRALSLNTNAVVLEALAYRARGPLLQRRSLPPTAEVRR